nr:MAG TPA: hypothetical protein [Caudoviricetes sp.]
MIINYQNFSTLLSDNHYQYRSISQHYLLHAYPDFPIIHINLSNINNL